MLALLILGTAALRVGFALAMGLGVDESYMVAAGRHVALSYFDHPPLAWWLSHAAGVVLGWSPLAVRAPFIALFALSTWLMARLGTLLYGERAGLWAAVGLNLAPVLGVTSATWVLPDGPLLAALLAAAVGFARAMRLDGGAGGMRWWVFAGLAAGLGMDAKYSAALVIGGAFLFLLTSGAGRRALATPGPWVSGLLSLALFAPVIAWNARHHWASFAFQGDRAAGAVFRPWMPFVVWAGEALFLLPWLWLALMALLVRALGRGPGEARGWFLAWLALPSVVLFAAISVWSRQKILFHWSAPGTMMLLPLFGEECARRLAAGERWVRRCLAGSAVLVVSGVVLVGSQTALGWLPRSLWRNHLPPDVEAIDWSSLRAALARRGLLARPGLVVAATRWNDAGKIGYALGPRVPVTVLNRDAREWGIFAPASRYRGRDLLLIDAHGTEASVQARYGPRFARLEPLPAVAIRHAGRVVFRVRLWWGSGFRAFR